MYGKFTVNGSRSKVNEFNLSLFEQIKFFPVHREPFTFYRKANNDKNFNSSL
jgi:hypothetical protein